MAVQTIKEMVIYQKTYSLAMQVFEASKSFPPEERWALTGQIRRSSRSVCNNLREAWAKRRYEAHFLSKLTDCDGEANETDTSLDFARDSGYITNHEHRSLASLNDEICRMLGSMIRNPKPFLIVPLPPKMWVESGGLSAAERREFLESCPQRAASRMGL